MRSSPRGPGDHESRLDPALGEACGDPADVLDRPAYQRCSLASSFLFWGEVRRLACWRRGPLVPSPADKRLQACDARARAICSAVPATGRVLPQELNGSVAWAPSTSPLPARRNCISMAPTP